MHLHLNYPFPFPVHHREDGSHKTRTSIVFQWRMKTSYPLTMEDVLSKVPSVFTNLPTLSISGEKVAEGDPGYYIYVMNMIGKKRRINAAPDFTVLEFKHSLQITEGVPVDQMRLIFDGRQLENDSLLEDYGAVNGSVFHLVLRLSGD